MVFLQEKLAQIVAQLSLSQTLALALPTVKPEPMDCTPLSPDVMSSTVKTSMSISGAEFPSPPNTPLSSMNSSSPDLPTFIKSSPRQSCARYTPARDLHTPVRDLHTPVRDVHTPAQKSHSPTLEMYTPASDVTMSTPGRDQALSPPFTLSPDSVEHEQQHIPFICTVSTVTSLADNSDLGSVRNNLNR